MNAGDAPAEVKRLDWPHAFGILSTIVGVAVGALVVWLWTAVDRCEADESLFTFVLRSPYGIGVIAILTILGFVMARRQRSIGGRGLSEAGFAITMLASLVYLVSVLLWLVGGFMCPGNM